MIDLLGLRRWILVAGVAAAPLCATSLSLADVAFGVRPSVSVTPGAPSGPTDIVVYNLPAAGSRYAGPADAYFDLTARVSGGGSAAAALFTGTLTVTGTGQVTFRPGAVDPLDPDPPNNIPYALNDAFPRTQGFDVLFAQAGNVGGANQSVQFAGVRSAPGDVVFANGTGIAAMPLRIAGGATGVFAVAFNSASRFENDTGANLTNNIAWPHGGGSVVVRPSLRGDLNGDLAVDGRDVAGFVAARGNLAAYQAAQPLLRVAYLSDFDEDGYVTNADRGGFIQAMFHGPPPPPTALANEFGFDYGVIQSHLGACGLGFANGDYDGSGCVGAGDYTLWADYFSPGALAASPALVPEPGAVELAAGGIAIVGLWGTRLRRTPRGKVPG